VAGTYVAAKVTSRYIAPRVTKALAPQLERLSARILEKVGESTAAKIGIKAGAGVLKAGGAVLDAADPFLLLSIGLDIADPLGYMDLTTKEILYNTKRGADAQFKKAIPKPIIVGPLDKMSSDTLQSKLTEQIKSIISAPDSPYMRPILDRIKKENATTDEQIDKIIDEETVKIDMTAVSAEAFNKVCLLNGGKTVGDSCSYKDAATCDGSYTWPIGDNDVYVEWNKQLGACAVAPAIIRTLCDKNKLPYDTNAGMCKIDEAYCKSKGADWRYNKKLGEKDCYIPSGQNALEDVFGTTFTRATKEVLDPEEYEKCRADEQAYGNYMCGVCQQNEEMDGLLCYPKCKTGYTGVGPVCWQKCPYGFTDNGAFCLKPAPYGRGTGFPWQFGDTVGSLDAARDRCLKSDQGKLHGCEQNGLIYYPKCKRGFHAVGCCICSPNCDAMSTDIGISCTKKSYGRTAGTVPSGVRFRRPIGDTSHPSQN
jgi:hypothetical protein